MVQGDARCDVRKLRVGAFGVHSADKVDRFTVFNVGGEGYRVVVAIHFNRQKLYIRHVFTHAEYERWSTRLRSGK